MESQKALHSQYVLQLLQLQRRTGFLCDITIYVRDQAFKAHKPLLAACSLYFRSIFADVENSQTKALNLASLTPIGFEILLEYIYSGSLAITFDNSKEVLSAATCLQMTNVVETCVNFIRSSFTKAPLNIGVTNSSVLPPVIPSPKLKKLDQTSSPTVQKQTSANVSVHSPRLPALLAGRQTTVHSVGSKPPELYHTASTRNTELGLPGPSSNITDISTVLTTEELNKIMPFLLAKNARRPTMQEVIEVIRKNFPQKFGAISSFMSPSQLHQKLSGSVTKPTVPNNAVPPPLVECATASQTTARSGDIVNVTTPEQTSGTTKNLAVVHGGYTQNTNPPPDEECIIVENTEEYSGRSISCDSGHRIGWNVSKSVQISTDLSGTPSYPISSHLISPDSTNKSPCSTRNAISDSELINNVPRQNHEIADRPSSEGDIHKYKRNDNNERISAEVANSAVSALFTDKLISNHAAGDGKQDGQDNMMNDIKNGDKAVESREDRLKKFEELLDHNDDEETTTCKIEREENDAWLDPDTNIHKSTSMSSVSSTSEDQALDLTTKYGGSKNDDKESVSSITSSIESPFIQISQTVFTETASPPIQTEEASTSSITTDYHHQNNLLDMAIQSAQQDLNNGFSRPVTFSRKPRRTSGGQTCQWPSCGRLFRHKNIYEEHIKLHEMGVPVSQLRKCYMGARVKKTVRERLEEMRTSGNTEYEKDDKEEGKKKKEKATKKRRTSAPNAQGYERKRVSPKDRLEFNQYSSANWSHGPPPSNLLMRSISLNSPLQYQVPPPPNECSSASGVDRNATHRITQDAHNTGSVVRNTTAVAETLAALGIQFPKRHQGGEMNIAENLNHPQVQSSNGPAMLNHLRMHVARREDATNHSPRKKIFVESSHPSSTMTASRQHQQQPNLSANFDRGYNV